MRLQHARRTNFLSGILSGGHSNNVTAGPFPPDDEPSTVWFDVAVEEGEEEEGEEIVTKRQEKKLRRNQRAVQQLQVRRRQRATSFTLRRHHKHHAVRQHRSKGSFSSKY